MAEYVFWKHEAVGSSPTFPTKWISSKRGVCVALKKQRQWFDSTLIHIRFIAQLDRAPDYELEGLRFDSL